MVGDKGRGGGAGIIADAHSDASLCVHPGGTNRNGCDRASIAVICTKGRWTPDRRCFNNRQLVRFTAQSQAGGCLIQICYTSRVILPFCSGDYNELAGQAQRLNTRDRLTGLLLYDGSRFLQAFEGPAAAADACMARISRDRRHTNIDVIGRRPITARQFGMFAMASLMPGEGDRSTFVAAIKHHVAHVQLPDLKALFIGFAVLSRPRESSCVDAAGGEADAR